MKPRSIALDRQPPAAGRNRVLFLGHAAERTGPPLILLDLLRWLDQHTEVECGVVLKAGGALLGEYREVAQVWMARDWLEPGATRLATRVVAKAGSVPLADRLAQARLRWPLRHIGSWPTVYANCAGSVTLLPLLPVRPDRLIVHVHELSVGLDYHLPDSAHDVLATADQVITVSDAVTDEVVARRLAPAERITRIPGCIDPEPAPGPDLPSRQDLGIPEDAFVIGASGLIHWRKAPDLFVSLAQRLVHDRADDPWFVWVGGDPDSAAGRDVMADAERAGVAHRLRLVPHQTHPRDWFRLFDVFALTAREDAFPLVCLEAASIGLPIVCFTSGGMPEFVGDDAGVVVPYPDLDAMAAAVRDLRADADRRRQMGQVGAARVRAYHDIPVVAARLAEQVLHPPASKERR